MMKKLLALALVVVLALSLAACGAEQVKITSIEDLTDKTVGVQLGTTGDIYISGDIADGVYGDAKVEQFSKGFEAVQALLQGKIHAVIIDDQPAKTFVESNADKLTILEAPYIEEQYAFAVKKESELLAQFNTAIAELEQDGTIAAIKDFYINGVEGATPYASPEGIEYTGKLVMATNAEFPPYEYHDTDADGNDYITGLDADLARAVCDKLGMELVIEDMAFDSVITAVQTGKADFGAAGLTITEDRLKSVDFTESYCTGIQVVIVKK